MGTVTADVLAIDGGNSKTDVALVDAHGDLLAHARGPGSSPHVLGIDGAVTLLDDLVSKAAAQAGVSGSNRVASYASVYLAGIDIPAETAVITEAIRRRAWAPELTVDNDTFALLRAGTDFPDAAAVVCGAGINCVGVARDGRHARFPALGRISGDWGGGEGLGEEALWWAARAIDGRGPATVLERAIAEHFGFADVSSVIEEIHFQRIGATRLCELSPAVLQAASAQRDAVAVGIVQRLAEEVVAFARAALTRLELLEQDTVVVLGGGVLTSRDQLLLGRIHAELTSAAPLARVSVTETRPIVGAALLGLDHIDASEADKARIRRALVDDSRQAFEWRRME